MLLQLRGFSKHLVGIDLRAMIPSRWLLPTVPRSSHHSFLELHFCAAVIAVGPPQLQYSSGQFLALRIVVCFVINERGRKQINVMRVIPGSENSDHRSR